MAVGIGILLLLALWSYTGYLQGRADFYAVYEGKEPLHAKEYAGLNDGGTIWFRGRGYSVYKLHRLTGTRYGDEPSVVLTGAMLRWHLPIRIFARDDEHFFYEPPPK